MMKKVFYLLFAIIIFITFDSCQKRGHVQTAPLFEKSIVGNDTSEAKIIEKKKDNLPIRFVLNRLHGFLDERLNIIVPPIYRNGFNYTDHGYALVSYAGDNNQQEGRILDRDVNIVFRENRANISILYDDMISYIAPGDRLHRVVRFRDNTIIAEGLGQAAVSLDGCIILARLFISNDWVFLDLTGKRILPHLVLHRNSRGFMEDRAVVVEGENRDIRIIDKEGNYNGELQLFRAGRNFSEGLLPAETTDGRTGYVNKNGEFVFHVPIVAEIPEYDESPLNATDFKNGYALVQTVLDPPIWRIINNHGEYVSGELPLLWADAFENGLSLVRIHNTEWGFMNTRGEMAFDLVFDIADSFHRGYARIVYKGRDGLINTAGKIFWSDEFVKGDA